MTESDKKIIGGTGIPAGESTSTGNISTGNISDVSGQVAIGKFIYQFKIEKPSGEELFKLIALLDQKRQEEFNKEIINKYNPSELPDYPPKLKEFVTQNRADEITKGMIYLQNHRILLISGIGGVGKTTLVRALVETRPANVPLPFWFDFGKKMDATLRGVLEKLAGYMNAPGIAGFREENREAGQDDINKLTGELQRRESLWLVFDNLETLLDKDRYFYDPGMDLLFTSLRKNTHNAKIIVTSRVLPLLRNGDNLIDVLDEKQELNGLKLNFAVDFLVKNGLEGVEHEKLEELATGVDGHPLALKLLIELVKKFGVSDTLNDLSMFQKHKEDTIKKARRLFEKLAGDEKELLERISVFRKPESMAAIKTMFTDRTSGDAVEKLMDKSLLETDHKGNYWLHPLIREFSYNDLKNKIEAHKLAYKYYLSLSLHLPEKRTKKEDVQSLIEAHYHACMAKEYDEAASIIYDYKLDEDLLRWGNYRALVELYSGVLPEDHFSDKPLLNNIKIHNRTLGNIGTAYRNLGNLEKAIEYYKKALKISQEINDKDKEDKDKKDESQWLGGLGNAYRNLGNLEKAIEFYEKALKISQEINDRIEESRWLRDLGLVYSIQNDSIKAIEYYKKALKTSQEIEDKDIKKKRKEESRSLGGLGTIYYNLNNLEKSIECCEKALKISQEINDTKGIDRSLGKLGNAYYKQGDMKKAIEFYKKALKFSWKEEIRGKCRWLDGLCFAFLDEKKYKEALACYLLAKDICTQIKDPNRNTTTESNFVNPLKEKLGEEEFEKLTAEVAPRAEEIVRELLK